MIGNVTTIMLQSKCIDATS